MEDDNIPYVTDALIRGVEDRFASRDVKTADGNEAIWRWLGAREVVEWLRFKQKEQREESED